MSPQDRRKLPYGKWTCENGRQVLFNRGYEPIYERSPEGSVSAAFHGEFIESIVDSVFFWDDSTKNAPKAAAVRKALNAWGLA
jgi:hypothetical protein